MIIKYFYLFLINRVANHQIIVDSDNRACAHRVVFIGGLLAAASEGGTKVESQNSRESTWCQVGCISQVPHYPRVRDP